MNVCHLSGRLPGNAQVITTPRVKLLKFELEAKHGYDHKKGELKTELIPCVLFDPTQAIEQLFTREGKGVFIECTGRITARRFERNGKEYSRIEVLVFDRYLEIIRC